MLKMALVLGILTAAIAQSEAQTEDCHIDMYTGRWYCSHRARPPQDPFEPNSSYRRRYRDPYAPPRDYRCERDPYYCRR